VILIFCAFGAELSSLRRLLNNVRPLRQDGLRGFDGYVGHSKVTLIATGIGMRRARHVAALALGHFQNIEWIVTTGVAGALDDTLGIGGIVVADRLMVWRGREFELEAEIEAPTYHRERFGAALNAAPMPFVIGPLLTSRRVIAKAPDKKRAHDAFGAIAVDMESAIIAFEAASRKVPFFCLRTIMDTAHDDIAAADLADENGRIKPLAAAAALMTQPRLVVSSLRLLRNLSTATRTMTQAIAVVLNAEL
jgi:adenosylhomocysteine nucleosidase